VHGKKSNAKIAHPKMPAVPGEPLSDVDFGSAVALHRYPFIERVRPDETDPIELAGLFEGDIMLTHDEDILIGNGPRKGEPDLNITAKGNQNWPNGNVPYVLSAEFNSLERALIAVGFLDIEHQTCIRFFPRTTEMNYIFIKKGKGCSSHVGMIGGVQPVILGSGCVYFPGVVTHELMHTLGFWHENSRSDRDDYVDVFPENIAAEMTSNFKKYTTWKSEPENATIPYDFNSILHYGFNAFARTRELITILPKHEVNKLGRNVNLSELDVAKINSMYSCGERETQEQTTQAPAPKESVNAQPSNPVGLHGGPCVDMNEFCPSWASGGECQRNPNYMLEKCKKSCDMCIKLKDEAEFNAKVEDIPNDL